MTPVNNAAAIIHHISITSPRSAGQSSGSRQSSPSAAYAFVSLKLRHRPASRPRHAADAPEPSTVLFGVATCGWRTLRLWRAHLWNRV